MPEVSQDQTEKTPAPAVETERMRDAQKLAEFLNNSGWDCQYYTYLLKLAASNNLISREFFKQ